MYKNRYSIKQKSWYRNMDNVIVNYHHMGEANYMYLIHMNDKCELDRLGFYPSIWRWK